MNDETEPIPVVDPRGGAGRGRRAQPGESPPRDRSGRRVARSATPPWNRGIASSAPPPRTAASERVGGSTGRVRRRRTAPPSRPARRHRGARISGRILVALTALAVIAGTGLGYYTERRVDAGFTRSDAITDVEAASLDGDLNILLIGLDTRKDQNGNNLPKHILAELHAGDGSEGGYNANALILVHIPKNLDKVTAFSIPRDDYVRVTGIPGYHKAKIKEAYGLKKAAVEQKLENQGIKDKVELEHRGREAGRESIVRTVKRLTGVPINRFAEISLVGFYDLAHILGGVDVCLNHAVDDEYYSGAVFPAGRQHLDASEALAFVRQRHGLDNGDLDRTHRQQAFLTSVGKQLEDSGTLTDIGKLRDLVSAAQQDVVLSKGWDLLDFARTLGRAGSVPIEFRTLPVQAYDTINGQAVNIIDPDRIKTIVRTAFGVDDTVSTTPATPPTSTVDVVNAGSENGMAGEVSEVLAEKGFPTGTVTTATYSDGSGSIVYFGSGADVDATQAADMLGGLPTLASDILDPGHVQVVLGSDFTLPAMLSPAGGSDYTSTDPTTTSDTATEGSTSTMVTTTNHPDTGAPLTTRIGDEIPCVN